MPAQPTPTFYNDLDASLDHAWAQLARGVADRRSACHTPTLATVANNGTPSVRTVILRGCDRASRMIRIHTDRRSAKVEELQHNPRAMLHFYDAGQKLQLRLAGDAVLHTADAVAEAAWAQSRPMSRAIYGQLQAPGTPIEVPTLAPLPAVADGATSGFANLMIIILSVQSLEWLYLGHQGHRRAHFSWDQGKLDARWLVP